MKKGFTILELLVASLLLGMLVTILTMIFNQSSIAWRTGVAGVADLDEVRENIASLRDRADSLYIWNDTLYRVGSVFTTKDATQDSIKLCKRAFPDTTEEETDEGLSKFSATELQKLERIVTPVSVGNGADSSKGIKTFIVNVKSAGPNRTFGDYDDIWSFPDDFD